MKQKCLIPPIIAMVMATNVFAVDIDPTISNVSRYCDCHGAYAGDDPWCTGTPILMYCNDNGLLPDEVKYHPSSSCSGNLDTGCVASGTGVFFCDPGSEDACDACFSGATIYSDGTFDECGDYTTHNSSRHSVKRTCATGTFDRSNDYSCAIISGSSTTEYGCKAGYYATSGVGTANITCVPCPDGGKSSWGNTSKSGCYLPAGAFSDATGSGQITGTCYWK